MDSNHQTCQKFNLVKSKIASIAKAFDRDLNSIELLVVSKGKSPELIRTLHNNTGHTDFAENYAQELLVKYDQLKDVPLNWHFIGRLQSNKIESIVKSCCEIQTLASKKHARLIAQSAKQLQKTPYPVYIAVNARDEPQKSGLRMDEVPAFAQHIAEAYPELSLKGIMTIPPKSYNDEKYQDHVPPLLYQELKALSQSIGEKKLSLGMSADMRIAIAAGSTCLRIGRAILGERDS